MRDVRRAPGPHPEPRSVRFAHLLGVRDAGRVLRDFATYLPTQAIPAIAGFIVLPVLARRLTPTELGVLAIAQTLVTLGWTVGGSWLATAIVREVPASRARHEVDAFSRTLIRAFAVSLGLFAAFMAVLAVAGVWSSAIGDHLLLLGAATSGLILQNIAVTLFAASLRPRAYAVVDVLARTGGIALGVALVFSGGNVASYLLGLAAASLVVGGVGLALGWPQRVDGSAGRPHLDVWLRYGIPSSAAALAAWAMFFVDRYVLALLEDTRAVGIYSVGNVIGDKLVSLPAFAFFTAAGPLLVTAWERTGRAEVERLMRSYTRILLLLGMPMALYGLAAGGELVELLAGRNAYAESAEVVPVVALGAVFYSLAMVGNTGLVVSKRSGLLAASAVLGLVANVAANLVLIPPFGVLGAAIATPIATGTFLLAGRFWSRRYTTWRFPYATLARSLVAALAAYGAAELVVGEGHAPAAALALTTGLGGLVYVGVLALLGEHRAAAA